MIITQASYTVARIKAAVFHTLADANVQCLPFQLCYEGKPLSETRTLESYQLSNTKDYWLAIKPINFVSTVDLHVRMLMAGMDHRNLDSLDAAVRVR